MDNEKYSIFNPPDKLSESIKEKQKKEKIERKIEDNWTWKMVIKEKGNKRKYKTNL